MSTLYEDDNDVIIVRIAKQVFDLNALSTMAMVSLSTFVYLLKDKLNLEN